MHEATRLFLNRDKLQNRRRKLKWYQFSRRRKLTKIIDDYTSRIDHQIELELLKH